MSSEKSNDPFEAADGYPRYHPQHGQNDPQSSRARAAALSIGIELIVGIAATVYGVLWLAGSHPLGVIGPAS